MDTKREYRDKNPKWKLAKYPHVFLVNAGKNQDFQNNSKEAKGVGKSQAYEGRLAG